MAYVQPNSIIQLFKGINLDNRYLHTIYFANESAQNSWFSGKATGALTFQQVSYTRYTRNSIKLKADTTDLMDCTYLRFKNDRNVDKWFYAFINAVEYVNEHTCLITYEIDVMQTWFIQNGSVRPCRVLREHVSDDTFGANLEAEPCGSDVYKMDLITRSNLFTKTSLVMNVTPTSDSDPVVNNGLYNGTSFYVAPFRTALGQVDPSAVSNITTALRLALGGSWDTSQQKAELLDMFTFPTEFANRDVASNTHTITITHPSTMGTYTPKNKKLLTYPYTYLGGTTKDGDSGIYRWEYFAGINTAGQVTFKAYGSPIGGGQIMCYPHTYDGVVDNIDCKMVMDNFPKNPFAYDAYQAWVASGGKTRLETSQAITNVRGLSALMQSASNLTMGQGINGVANAGRNAYAMEQNGGATAGMIAGMTGGLNQTVQASLNYVDTAMNVLEAKNKIAYQFLDASYRPNMVVGTATPNLAVSLDELDFHFFNVYVEEDEAKRLDDFFSCFGYQVNRVKAPNITGRQYWNFVQTENCVIAGNMPSSSKDAIARIFDGGITFWHNGDNVGNYAISITDGTINNPIV